MMRPTPDEIALDWLRQAFNATGGRGFSHSYRPLSGWAKAYPETTGYLIETLLTYSVRRGEASLRRMANSAADWLCDIQRPDGAFPALLMGNPHPSVFNTAQILFGLTQTGRKTAALRARNWLLAALEADGSWRTAAYQPGFTPSYYTRAVWGVLYSLERRPEPENREAMRRALRFYSRRIRPNGAVADWGFLPGQPAYTHTLAYTLEGFLESALLLSEWEILEKTGRSIEALAKRIETDGRLAGRYDLDWRGDFSFQCLPGLAQCSLLLARWYALRGQPRCRALSAQLLETLLPHQYLYGPAGVRGGIPGSAPVWGPYLRFRFPNWGVKFFLDALLVGQDAS
jgi:hypothetical protein